MMYFTDDVVRLAKNLATASGWTMDSQAKIADGFSVPVWVTFLQVATRLEIEQRALKGKP